MFIYIINKNAVYLSDNKVSAHYKNQSVNDVYKSIRYFFLKLRYTKCLIKEHIFVCYSE